MGRLLQLFLLLSTIAVLLVNCRKKQWDEYYGRPDSLEPPIYQVLQSKGNFTSLLACIDKAGYKDILSKTGYWTLFAPTDAAFTQFFKDRNISGIADLDSMTAQKIVRFCLVYNSFDTVRLDDYQSNRGWMPDDAYRRRTTYYELFDTAMVNGQMLRTVPINRNGFYAVGDNNNKYIPYFTNAFLAKRKISATDYSYFYPGVSYTGLNVMDAHITETDIAAENGKIHAIDKVLTAIPNIEKYLASKPEFSLFKSLFDRFMVVYVENPDVTHRYQVLYGGSDKVYIKFYNAGLAFSPGNENYLKAEDNDAQTNGFTLFAPANDVLEPYLKSVILEHYNNDLANLNKLPTQILVDFLNAHMWQTPVWPTKFASSGNYHGEPARFDPYADILDKKILSNGFFYGARKVQHSDLFSTVYARPYLDPKYSLMTRLLNTELRPLITNPNFNYTILMMSDDQIRQLGFDWDGNRSSWINTKPGVLGAGDAGGTVNRLVNMHVIATPKNELGNLAGEGIIETIGGEMIKFKDGQLFAAGNIDSNKNVSVTATKFMNNGTVYYTDQLLYFSAVSPGKRLEALAADSTSPYFMFFQYLKNSKLYTASTGTISVAPLGFFGTFLIPDNNAMKQAVNDGILPGTGTAPNKVPVYNPADGTDQEKVSNFMQYHILKKSVINDGKSDGNLESTYRSLLTDEIGYVHVVNIPGTFSFADTYGRTATINPAASNVLADRIVFHSINNYLKY